MFYLKRADVQKFISDKNFYAWRFNLMHVSIKCIYTLFSAL